MPSKEEYEAAARKTPSQRSVSEQALVDKGREIGVGNVRNLDHKAKNHEKIYGK
jgi:hypothetical protein